MVGSADVCHAVLAAPEGGEASFASLNMLPSIARDAGPASLNLTTIHDAHRLDELLLSLGGSLKENCADFADSPGLEERRALRFKLREFTTHACRLCGRMPAGPGNVVQVHLEDGKDGQRRARFAGPRMCRSKHACPVCSPALRAEDAAALRRTVMVARQQGLQVFMLTLTVWHALGDRLKFLMPLLRLAWRYLITGTEWRRLRRKPKVDLVGAVRALETTFGRAGWHPLSGDMRN